MGVEDRQRKFVSLLERSGLRVGRPPAAPRLKDLPTTRGRVLELYRHLGGVQDEPVLRPRGWDVLADGVLVELDEEQHFNRYRALTLHPAWAQHLPWARTYEQFCALGEPVCVATKSGGGFWTSASSVDLFGPCGRRGDLDNPAGSPRWKQRALYDAIRDAYALEGHPVARVSVYDIVQGSMIGDVLRSRAVCDPDALRDLVQARTTPAHAPGK